jgi:hypothetical protein
MTGNRRRLDDLLQRWAASRKPDAQRLDALRQSAAKLASAPDCGVPLPPWERGQRTVISLPILSPLRMAAWGFATATVALLAVGLAWLVRGHGTQMGEGPAPSAEHVRPDGPAPAPPWLAPPRVDGKRELLVELQRVFEGRVAWVAETASQIRLGLNGDDAGGAALAIRLVLVQRLGDAAPRPVWAVDLISGEERLVNLPADAAEGAEVAVWTYALPDGLLAVDGDIRWPQQSELPRAQYTGLLRPDVPQVVFQWRSDGVEYEVYQSVSVLDS